MPKGTPPEIVQRLAKEIKASVEEPAVKARLEQLGLEPVGSTPAEFAKFLEADMSRAAFIVKARNIKPD